METPSSTRRITRSQALALSASTNSNLLISRKFEESETKSMQKKSAEKNRSALVDITNDSPIVGLAMGNLETPSSIMSKKRISGLTKYTRTPGSGEALLRGQVKTLLQKVEEEGDILKIEKNRPFFNLQGISLVAPTPANTPQVLNFSGNGGLPSIAGSPVDATFLIPQVVISDMLIDGKEEKPIEYNLVTKLDFSTLHSSDSSESSSSSSILTYQGGLGDSSREKQSSTDDDASSIWSIQVNASSTRDDDEEVDEFGDFTDETEECGYVEEDYGDIEDEYELRIVDDLCEGISKMSVTKFTGKHIRFVYNADDELQVEEVTATVTD